MARKKAQLEVISVSADSTGDIPVLEVRSEVVSLEGFKSCMRCGRDEQGTPFSISNNQKLCGTCLEDTGI